MKVLLIKPPITYYKSNEDYSPYEPLGIMYLAAYLKEYSSHEVKILDASVRIDLKRKEGDFLKYGYTDDMIAREISNFQPDIVGISAMFTINSKGVHDTAGIIKRLDRNIPVVVGGAHASAFPQWILSDKNIDAVVKGEGEQTLLEILNNLKTNRNIYEINGLIFRKDNQIIQNSHRPFIKELDIIPLPARDLVDMNVYFNEKYNYSHSMSPPRSTMITSRGCPYKCIFCSIHSLWRHSYRMRKPKNVVDEIEYLMKNYGVREIAFFDDNLSVSRNRMLEICDEIINRDLKIRWCTPNGIAIWTLDEQLLQKMKKSGCYKLTFGIETGSVNTQKFIRKDYIDLNRCRELIRYCKRIGIWTHSSFIIGFPYETENDIMQTINYAVDCDVDMATFFIATPYPGTELYDIYEKEGLLPDMGDEKSLQWLGSVGRSMSDTKNMTKKQIENYVCLAQKRVYLHRASTLFNPFTLLPKIAGKEEFGYFRRQFSSYSVKLISRLFT